MDTELKSKWIAALRSGEYQQGKEYLHKDGAYCCIGVLCRIAGADMTKTKRMAKNRDATEEDESDEHMVQPTAWIDADNYTEDEELNRLLPYFGVGTKVESLLITMNDTDAKDFNGIADWIEGHDLESGKALTD